MTRVPFLIRCWLLAFSAPMLVLIDATCVRAQASGDSTVATARPFFGNYLRSDGTLVSIGRGEQSVFLMDYRTGSRDGLRSRGPGSLADPATGATITLRTRDGDTALVVHTANRAWTARRQSLVRTGVQFRNDTVTLAGTLWEPIGRGPFPAIVLLHGAGEETRYAMRQYPYFFVSHGYAVLTYDKRGSGASTGDWHPWVAGTDVLAADAAAAVQLLRARSEIRPDRVGLLGISNGAWVTVRTAAHTPHIAFIIPVVGGGIPMWQQELYRIANEGRAHNLAPVDQAALERFMSALYSPLTFDSLARVPAITRLDSLRAEAHGTPWFAETPLAPFGDARSATLFALGQQAWRRELSYDPSADLRTLHQPMLAILGRADQEVPTAVVASALRRDVPLNGDSQRTIVIIPAASHYLLLPDDPAKPTVDRFDPELFTTLGRWLDARRR
ncbi:MAG: alpha/beta fold hydrolase [Gemmatimonadaceae bacterium]